MAFIGFIAILALGASMIVVGFASGWLFLATRDRMCIFLSLVTMGTGVGAIFIAAENAPFTITIQKDTPQ